MNRFTTPRSIGLGSLAVVLMATMGVLGLWQLGVYDDQQRDDAAAQLQRAPVPVDDVLSPDGAFTAAGVSRPVIVSGEWLDSEQAYVSGLAGSTSDYAVVTPLLTDSGSAVLVVRGSTGDPPTAAPSGPATVIGVLAPPTELGRALDEQRVTDGLRIAVLVEGFSADLYGGYVIATSGAQAAALAPIGVPASAASRWAGLRNLLYAIQWWLFAAFVAFMWWRIVADLDADDGAARPMTDPDGPVGEPVRGSVDGIASPR